MGIERSAGKRACWKIGNSMVLDTWNAPWVPEPNLFKPKSRINIHNNPTCVLKIIMQNPVIQGERKIIDTFDSESARKILQIHLPQSQQENSIRGQILEKVVEIENTRQIKTFFWENGLANYPYKRRDQEE